MKLPEKYTKLGYTVFDATEHLKTEEEIGYFLEAAFEMGGDDPEYIAHVLGIVARALCGTGFAQVY